MIKENKSKYITTTTPRIYGLKVNGDLIYIGKTHVGDKNGNLKVNKIQSLNMNPKIKKLINDSDNDVSIAELKPTTMKKWYKDRNNEAHFKFVNGEIKLVNDPWILEGKNGYWQDKQRDENTLKQLSESKFKKIAQYDKNGNLIKIWDSGKHIGEQFFNDYKLKNGSASSLIYYIVSRTMMKNRLHDGFYWFKESELLENFNQIPKKLNIRKILKVDKQIRDNNRNKTISNNKYIYHKVYSIIKISKKTNKPLFTYKTAEDAAKKYSTNADSIRRACRTGNEYLGYYWQYGEKHQIKFKNIHYNKYL